MTLRQRWVSVVGIVVLLWAAAGAVVPFHAAAHDCGPPAAEAFKGDDVPAGLNAARRQAGIPGDLRLVPPCRTPARHRLQRAGVIATAAIVGTLAAVFLLRSPGREEVPRP